MVLIVPLLLSCGLVAAADPDWVLYKSKFVKPDGRVVDTGNEGISHTEGQGVTMLLAVHHDDRATFDAAWRWTQTMLQVREDKLLAWRWISGEGVTDKNNATDGDIFAAWALLRAHKKWQHPLYQQSAHAIMSDIRKSLVRSTPRGVVLLPGAVGFEKPQGLVVNLSYWIFPAFDELAQEDPQGEWLALKASGVRLLQEARFGRWGLPADWVLLDEKITLHGEPRFGYDAVRIPMYMLWGKVDDDGLTEPFRQYWSHFKGASFLPAWTNLQDNSVDSYNASVGMRSIAQSVLGGPDQLTNQLPSLDSAQSYYSSILLQLTKLALSERTR